MELFFSLLPYRHCPLFIALSGMEIAQQEHLHYCPILSLSLLVESGSGKVHGSSPVVLWLWLVTSSAVVGPFQPEPQSATVPTGSTVGIFAERSTRRLPPVRPSSRAWSAASDSSINFGPPHQQRFHALCGRTHSSHFRPFLTVSVNADEMRNHLPYGCGGWCS